MCQMWLFIISPFLFLSCLDIDCRNFLVCIALWLVCSPFRPPNAFQSGWTNEKLQFTCQHVMRRDMIWYDNIIIILSYRAIHLTSCNVTWTQSLLSSYVTRWISNSTQSHRQLVNVQISSCSVLQRDKRSTQVKRPLEQLNQRHKTLVSICIFARYWSLLVIKVFSTSCTKQCRKSIFGPRCVSKNPIRGKFKLPG